MDAPVLLIGFNRPDTMQEVFNAVKIASPSRLYYAVDGPRVGKGEDEKVQMVRDIVKQVDWPCELHTLFREENVGCGRGPAEAISWAFENEECLIVLEDDCLPSPSFFTFCDEMLQLYKDDERVNIVSGRSHWHGSSFFLNYDYVFTHYAHTWGWATWKRVWKEFDLYMRDFPDYLHCGGGVNIFYNEKVGIRSNKSLSKIFHNIEQEVSHSWDSQFFYTRLKTGGLGIVPCRNLIRNIGFGGTHCFSVDTLLAEEMPLQLRHPRFVLANRSYDEYHYKNWIYKNIIKNSFPIRVIRQLINKMKVLGRDILRLS